MPPSGDHDVLRLEIPVCDPLGMCRSQCFGDWDCDFKQFVCIEPVVGENVRKRLPIDEFHRQVVNAVVLFNRVNGDDVGMVQRGEQPGFTLKPGKAVGICGKFFGQSLDRNFTAELRVASLPHFSHPAPADGRDNRVVTEL